MKVYTERDYIKFNIEYSFTNYPNIKNLEVLKIVQGIKSLDPETATLQDLGKAIGFGPPSLGSIGVYCTSCHLPVEKVIDFGDVPDSFIGVCTDCLKKGLGLLNE